ncbi:MAG: UDP-N-acetylglucosamine 1-carboxyvinyltransferase [Nitriliruptoraceae bacterium]
MQTSPATDDRLLVRGGRSLCGTVRLTGAKNSALKLMAAALLADSPVHLSSVPDISDVEVMKQVLEGLGVTVDVDPVAATVTLHAADPGWSAPAAAATRIRASISCLGPLVARVGRARLALPGGDRIGARTIDLHVRGLEAMGASVHVEDGHVDVQCPRLTGAQITLEFPSVGATENLLMAATLADGVTVIDNAAREPEIRDLCNMLVSMGAIIDGIGSATLTITGVERLTGTTWTTCPDRIEAGTYAMAAAVTGGDVRIETVRPSDLTLPLLKLREIGVTIEEGDDWIAVKAGDLRPIDVVTLPYPGFPTDLQPQLMVLLTQASGVSRCTENVFESRFAFVDELARMGADIRIDGHHAFIHGPTRLQGHRMTSLDVRAGAAATMAGLVADGETVVTDVHHIDRGYANFVLRLQQLGADIERVPAAADS